MHKVNVYIVLSKVGATCPPNRLHVLDFPSHDLHYHPSRPRASWHVLACVGHPI